MRKREVRKRKRKGLSQITEPDEEDHEIILIKDDFLDEVEKKMIETALKQDKKRKSEYIV